MTNSPPVQPPSKRRRLLPESAARDVQLLRPDAPVVLQELQDYHAKLTTINYDGHLEEVFVGLDRPVTVGRHPNSTYVVSQPLVSSTHFTINAVKAASGGLFLSCLDSSRNGTLWNGHLIKKTPIIVNDGDVLQIPRSQTFRVWVRNKYASNIKTHDSARPEVQYSSVGAYLVSNQYLGDGSFGRVRLAIDDTNNRQLACKTIWTHPNAGHNASKSVVKKEVDILKGLNHPNVNRIFDVFYDDDRLMIHIFLELCTGGDLLQFIEERGNLNDGESKFIGFQLMKALQYLHSRKISHRDLKPENVLLLAPSSYPHVMLADFGFARTNSFEPSKSLCGTVSYVPPEALAALFGNGGAFSGLAFDCWSLGVCLYFMISGRHPFDYGFESDEEQKPTPKTSAVVPDSQESIQTEGSCRTHDSTASERIIKQRIASGPVKFEWEGWNERPEAHEVCRQLLRPDPKTRLTVQGALRSQWIEKDLDLLMKVYEKKIGKLPEQL